eukprot:GEMP01021796.1.p1 GENE.GEMP01021796.1~~GEMP01021796.1.p1  ORF type:complete len:254 (+),score=38.33 GEMP01021796.1:320-1081(+)
MFPRKSVKQNEKETRQLFQKELKLDLKKDKDAVIVKQMVGHMQGFNCFTIISVLILTAYCYGTFLAGIQKLATRSFFRGSLNALYIMQSFQLAGITMSVTDFVHVLALAVPPGSIFVLCIFNCCMMSRRGRNSKCKNVFHSLVCSVITYLLLFSWVLIFDYLSWFENILNQCSPGVGAFGGVSATCPLNGDDWDLLCTKDGMSKCYIVMLRVYNLQLSGTFIATCIVFSSVLAQVLISDWIAVFYRSAKLKSD